MYRTQRMSSQRACRGEVLRHLRESDSWQWIAPEGKKAPDTWIIGTFCKDRMIGHLSLRVQPVQLPTDPPEYLRRATGNVWETFVCTFFVEQRHRRRGVGRRLQLEGLRLSADLGVHQMRSWSSRDKTINHHLKVGLGFAAVPATQTSSQTGREIPGFYFVKHTDDLRGRAAVPRRCDMKRDESPCG